MSTRSNIAVVVKSEDLGKTMKFDVNKVPRGKMALGVNEMGEVTIEKPVLEIYHHWDGYPDGVGKTLINEFNDYDKALNLVLGGDVSTINGLEMRFYCEMDGWDECKTSQYDVPTLYEEYIYKFEDGVWYFQGEDDTEWRNLSEYLKTLENDGTETE